VIATQKVAFTWRPAETLLDLSGAVEDAEPYSEAWEKLKEEFGFRPDFTDEYRDWRVAVGDSTGKTTEVLDTYRQVTDVEWDKQGGLVARLATSKRVPSPILQRDVKYEWHGTAAIDPGTGDVTTTFDDLPAGLDGV
jgi:hypothetical protein